VNDGGFESLPPARGICRYVITSRWSCRLGFHLIREDFVCRGSPGSMGLQLVWYCGFDSAAQLNSMLGVSETLFAGSVNTSEPFADSLYNHIAFAVATK